MMPGFVLRHAVTLSLLVLAGLLFVEPRLALSWIGRAPLADLDPAGLSENRPTTDPEEGARRLGQRQQVRIVVPRNMTVAELLDLLGLDLPHVRRSLAIQEGRPELDDDHVLQAGSVYLLMLVEEPGGSLREGAEEPPP